VSKETKQNGFVSVDELLDGCSFMGPESRQVIEGGIRSVHGSSPFGLN
jgi:hypothetical protein